MNNITKLRIGTRGSPLALAQAELTRAALAKTSASLQAPDAIEIVVIRTTGDHVLDRPLAEIGGKGLFTKEIEEALLAGAIDLAVHSMKDVPTYLPEGLSIVAVLPRADPRDALIARGVARLDDLPQGASLGTASLRRAAQALARRPDLRVTTLRGSVQTRLKKVEAGEVDATMLAVAGLDRLGIEGVGAPMTVDEMLPAVAQGAIGIECRLDDADTRALLAGIDDAPTNVAVTAERAFLTELDGSCRTPIAGYCQVNGDGCTFAGLAARPDGSRIEREGGSAAADDVQRLAAEAGRSIRGRLGAGFFT